MQIDKTNPNLIKLQELTKENSKLQEKRKKEMLDHVSDCLFQYCLDAARNGLNRYAAYYDCNMLHEPLHCSKMELQYLLCMDNLTVAFDNQTEFRQIMNNKFGVDTTFCHDLTSDERYFVISWRE